MDELWVLIKVGKDDDGDTQPVMGWEGYLFNGGGDIQVEYEAEFCAPCTLYPKSKTRPD